MTRAFTRDKLLWLEQVRGDTAMPANAFRLAHAIASYVNQKTRTAWPTQLTLAADLNLSTRTVRTLTNQLVKRGHLAVRIRRAPGGGAGRSTVYMMRHQDTAAASKSGDTGKLRPANRKFHVAEPERRFRKNSDEEHYDEHGGSEEDGEELESTAVELRIDPAVRAKVVCLWRHDEEHIPRPATEAAFPAIREHALKRALGRGNSEADEWTLTSAFKRIPPERRRALDAAIRHGKATLTDVAALFIEHGFEQRAPRHGAA